jgi:hypothetical protein
MRRAKALAVVCLRLLLEIEQLVGPGEVAALPLLPSVRYHPAAGELAAGELQLPWIPAAEARASRRRHRPTGRAS